jgi:hypothetical protein
MFVFLVPRVCWTRHNFVTIICEEYNQQKSYIFNLLPIRLSKIFPFAVCVKTLALSDNTEQPLKLHLYGPLVWKNTRLQAVWREERNLFCSKQTTWHTLLILCAGDCAAEITACLDSHTCSVVHQDFAYVSCRRLWKVNAWHFHLKAVIYCLLFICASYPYKVLNTDT